MKQVQNWKIISSICQGKSGEVKNPHNSPVAGVNLFRWPYCFPRNPILHHGPLQSLKLERLAHHHLHPGIFIGGRSINTEYDALGPGPDAQTDIPFHVGVQRT